MKLIFLSLKLYLFGLFCDFCVNTCTKIAEKRILKNQPLNKKLLTKMSNLSNNSLTAWHIRELNFIRLSLEKLGFWLS